MVNVIMTGRLLIIVDIICCSVYNECKEHVVYGVMFTCLPGSGGKGRALSTFKSHLP